jgi:pantoate--beta-alanine ligase
MQIIESIREMQLWSEAARRAGKRIILVPTMGALHEGHLNLVREGRKRGERLVVSLFVNPSQFAPSEDFAAYPRDFERDRGLLEKEKVDVLFGPSVQEMYPVGFQTYIEVEKLSPVLCGVFRPGHFRGVATVVAKLFNVVRPHDAIFGAKDYQQLQLIRRMVKDLNFDVEVVSHPTVREKDGLALSSRNFYLGPEERAAALSLYRSLEKARSLVARGERESRQIIREVRTEIEREPLARIEYVKLCDPETLEELAEIAGDVLLALAVRIGGARLIDNAILKA